MTTEKSRFSPPCPPAPSPPSVYSYISILQPPEFRRRFSKYKKRIHRDICLSIFSSRVLKRIKGFARGETQQNYTPYTEIFLNIYKLSHLNGLGGKMSMSFLWAGIVSISYSMSTLSKLSARRTCLSNFSCP